MADTPAGALAPPVINGLKSDMANVDAPWASFDSDSYEDHNYREVRDDDRQIMCLVRDHFSRSGVLGGRGLDVGAGANLYPSMAMLPFCGAIDLWEFAPTNAAWLRRQVRNYGANWNNFWAIYRQAAPYRGVTSPRVALRKKAVVREGSIFDLPKAHWDIGTMFFVACSLSNEFHEFDRAVKCFLAALRPGAPFAAAFMLGSDGYRVGDVTYPAVSVGRDDVSRSMAFVAYDVDTQTIETKSPLRPGYEGMLLVTGRAGQPT